MPIKKIIKPSKPVLTRQELMLVMDALDSHAYWQLSDPAYRNNGAVCGQGSFNKTNRAALKRTDQLYRKVSAGLGRPDALLED